MEHAPQPQIEQPVSSELSSSNSLEQGIEQVTISKKRKVLRSGMQIMRAGVAAALVGIAGGAATDANAQYQVNTQSGYGNNSITSPNGVVRVGSVDALGKVVAMGAINGVLQGANAPVRVGMQNGKPVLDINMNPSSPPMVMILKPRTQEEFAQAQQQIARVQQQLAPLGYTYSGNPPIIYSISDPNTRLNIGPATTNLVITKSAGSEAVLVDLFFMDANNRSVLQKFVINKGQAPIQVA